MKVHFIAIGGSAMHNLAIALHKKGIEVSGSDDEIFDPSYSHLKKYDLLPSSWGWDISKINKDLDAVILGMHAREDNPELQKAKDLGLKIYSYPEYIYEQTKDKIRIVVGGSHGKTSTTSMVMHVLKDLDIDFDYMVGADLDGFDTMVRLSEDAKYVVLEGDEYLSSPIDLRPKFHLYNPNIAVITGIAWDHINVFPTFDNYLSQFEKFSNMISESGSLIYYREDENLRKIASNLRSDIKSIGYVEFNSIFENDKVFLVNEGKKYPLRIFGSHNLQNISAAYYVCKEIGISKNEFCESMSTFTGASKRLQVLDETNDYIAFQDFAHSPSKLKATVKAVREQYPNRQLIACMELHTFSSLKKEFLPQYKDSLKEADIACIYYNPEVVKHKHLSPFSEEDVKHAFGKEGLNVFTKSEDLVNSLNDLNYKNTVLLLMSSGTFGGLDLEEIAKSMNK
ncbi:MAG: Mur ligase family protein [Marinifilaceae bacterium]|jgi:UDP-N-acetylmuramate: L-alanyl-gamma-D-glutamyl-meso-diaminopimelate ligase|nr:Mur ligase family protein [Marinifilaceae bacterium]